MDRYPEPKRGAVSGKGHATDLDRAFHTFRICGCTSQGRRAYGSPNID
jgi:hypothetical protein